MTHPRILTNRARCLLCLTTIESTHRHDFKWCSCGEIAVDGGRSYLKRAAKDFNNLEELSTTEEEEREEKTV